MILDVCGVGLLETLAKCVGSPGLGVERILEPCPVHKAKFKLKNPINLSIDKCFVFLLTN